MLTYTARITARGADSCVPDNPRAVDAMISTSQPGHAPVELGEVTLLPDHNGDLVVWGDDMGDWASDGVAEHLDAVRHQRRGAIEAIVDAVRVAAEKPEFEPDGRPLILTGAYLTRWIRSGVMFKPEDVEFSEADQALIREGKAEIVGDTEKGLKFRVHLDKIVESLSGGQRSALLGDANQDPSAFLAAQAALENQGLWAQGGTGGPSPRGLAVMRLIREKEGSS